MENQGSNKETHFMDGETTLKMYEEAFTPAFRARRRLLEVDATARGALLFDRFTGNSAMCAALEARRGMWADADNVALLPPLPAGGHIHTCM